MKPERTKVLFRWFRKEALALFPAEAGTFDLSTCFSYQQCGQHSSAGLAFCIQQSHPATPQEYRDFAAELRRMGYRLEIRQRATRKDFLNRKDQTTN